MKKTGFPWWIIVLFLIIGVNLMPLIPVMILGYAFYIAIKKNERNKKPVVVKRSKELNKAKTNLSSREIGVINKKLKVYFETHDKLPILDDISLKPIRGTYTNLSQLYLYKNDECISPLNEFGAYYPSLFNEINNLLLVFAKSNEQIEDEIKEATVKPVMEKASNATSFIDKINNLNQAIEHQEITTGLYQTCSLLKHIEHIEKTNPENKSKLTKLYDYYLPILVGILENYKRLSYDQNNEEYKKCESQLIKTIILINEALKNITSTLHEDDYMNLSADITTLQSLLKKDGLVDEGTIKLGGKEND